ncbi:hypothetical protein BDV09DRAFT_175802 [Aspergillus tetrazonus]
MGRSPTTGAAIGYPHCVLRPIPVAPHQPLPSLSDRPPLCRRAPGQPRVFNISTTQRLCFVFSIPAQ